MCTVEGRGSNSIHWEFELLPKSGFTKQYIVFSPVWSVSLVSWLPYRGSGSFHKALGGWGIHIIWRNLNSIFCSVTFQSAESVRPCIDCLLFFCFYSQPSFKKSAEQGQLYILWLQQRPVCEHCQWWTDCSYRGLNRCGIVWSIEQAQFDLFSWIIKDLTFPPGFPRAFLPPLCRKTCGQVVPVGSGSFRISLPKVHLFHEVYT